MKPFPTELQNPINPEAPERNAERAAGVEAHRNFFCVHYDTCLGEAVKKGWNSFSCLRCAWVTKDDKPKDESAAGLALYATQRRAN